MKILETIFKISDKKIMYLDKIKRSVESIIPLILILLGVAYALTSSYPFFASILGGLSLIVIYLYLIILTFLYLYYRYLMRKKDIKNENKFVKFFCTFLKK